MVNTQTLDDDDGGSTNRNSDLHQEVRGVAHYRHGTNKHMLDDDRIDNFGDRAGPREQKY